MKIAGKGFSGRLKLLPVFCAGLLAGIVIMNLGKSILLENTGLFDEDTLYHIKYMTVEGSALFSYVFRKRIITVMILAMLATTYLGLAVCMGTAFWYGMSAGGYLTALALRYGLKGILLALAGVFPQYLLYVPALMALLAWSESLFRGIYSRSGTETVEDRGFLIKKLGWLLAILGAVLAGCFLEAYVNPRLLLGYLQVF